MKLINKPIKTCYNIYMGISIFKPRFLKLKSLKKDISKIKEINNNFCILVADLPEIYNLTTLDKYTRLDAELLIKTQCNHVIDKIKKIDEDIDIFKWADIRLQIRPYLKEIEFIISIDKDLTSLLRSTVIHNLRKRYPHINEREIDIVSFYLLEELAQTWCFFEENIVECEAYPGKIPKLKEILFSERMILNKKYKYINILNN